MPLVLSHGWPGSVVEFLDCIGPLVDPPDPRDAFTVVVPSLPGYGFSGPTSAPGWTPRRIGGAFATVMERMGYDRYGVQGGDWGSMVSANMADLYPDRVAGLHLNFLTVPPPKGVEAPAHPPAERFAATGNGYQQIQGTKPQTVGYLLEDSPAGLAGWIVEKFREWSDCDGDPERSFSKDQLLTNVMVYWVTRTATSAARLYWEMRQAGRSAVPQAPVTVPTGVANFPVEVARCERAWAERRYNIVHWSELPRGGHFAAMEVPDLFVDDVRTFFRLVR
jgi:microsomal epoxide hydrolase